VLPETATHARRYLRAGVSGAPDIICVMEGQDVGIEVEALKGKQSDHQKAFQAVREAAGGRYFLAYSLEDVITQLSV